MTRYRRWPSMAAWRALRRSSPRVRDSVLPYFEQPKIKLERHHYPDDEVEKMFGAAVMRDLQYWRQRLP